MLLNSYKIGKVAELLNITVRTIRYYEEENLLNPHRTDGGTRLYTEQDIARLKAILHLTENDFSLEVIKLLGDTRNFCVTGDEGSKKISNIINESIKNVDDKIDNLSYLKKELSSAKKLIEKCKGCQNKPSSEGCPECPVNENISNVKILNLIWE